VQVYACLSQAGFDAVAPLLSAPQSAALAVVREYVRLRQGEVWRDIAAAFEAEGLAPSQEDWWVGDLRWSSTTACF
jgi:hypothetical protein